MNDAGELFSEEELLKLEEEILDDVPDSASKTMSRFTARRFLKNRPAEAKLAIKWLGQGIPVAQIADALKVSRNTLDALRFERAPEIEQQKKLMGAKARGLQEKLLECMEAHLNDPVRMETEKLKDMSMAMDKLVSVSQLLEGKPTKIVGKVQPQAEPFNIDDYLNSLPHAHACETHSAGKKGVSSISGPLELPETAESAPREVIEVDPETVREVSRRGES